MYKLLICILSFVILSSCSRNEDGIIEIIVAEVPEGFNIGSLLQQSHRLQKKAGFRYKCTGKNEVFSKCASECDPKCYQIYNEGIPNCNPETCTLGCICKRGTARRYDGVCVPYNICEHVPPVTKFPNFELPPGHEEGDAHVEIHKEPYEDELSGVQPRIMTTWNGGFKPDYELGEPLLPSPKLPPGYKGVSTGKCTGINEVFTECNAECDTKCHQIFGQEASECIPQTCTPGCTCRKGTARRHDGTCVPLNLCMAEKSQKEGTFGDHDDRCLGQNEEFTDCNADCDFNCQEIVFGVPECKPQRCKPGCICKKGFARRLDKTCVRFNICLAELSKSK